MPVDHERLTELFGEAMDLAPDDQRALLLRVQDESPELAHELASMLAADGSIVTALRTAGLKPDDVDEAFRRRTAMPPGAIDVPGYVVRMTLGEGGMGVVYFAESEDLGLPVAIKVLHVTAAEARARFTAEAEIMKQLAHPSIARVLASGEAGGHPYIVMELVDGATLDAYVRRHKPSVPDRLRLFVDLCDGMAYAHSRGVVHRDLKPANIMVRHGGHGVAVLDFGVARIGRSSGSTRVGDFLGTPLYMSPEQALGRAVEADARTDVYALGVILFELITGAPPYSITGLPFAAAVRTIAVTPAPPLGHSAGLDAIAARALAKDPAQRYASAAALATELRALRL